MTRGDRTTAKHPCGPSCRPTDPRPGDGYDTGTWTSTHTYTSVASLPTDVCVITYDLGFGRPPTPHRLNFDNNDNSVQWALFTAGSWDMSVSDDNCSTLPPPVARSPSRPRPPSRPPVKTVSHTTSPASTCRAQDRRPSQRRAGLHRASAGRGSSWRCWASSWC